jgi:chemotaxis regulatin CheY-phosphate phosphatase CheZ
MTTPWVEYCLWALVGAVTGAALTAWTLREVHGYGRSATAGSEASELSRLKEHQQAWEAFAVCATHLIPVLKKQMEGVTQQTERAAMDLMVSMKALASPATASNSADTSTNLTKVVMAMQFQDITQQKLEHVAQALDQWHTHLQALLKGPQDEEARREIASLQQIEESYTMEEERRLHAVALAPDYQEPMPIESEETEEKSASVTLF